MNRRLVLILALIGMLFAGSLQARGWSNFSIGYSDYGRHGGYSISLGGFGSPSWAGFGWSPGYDYGYRDRYWRDPWYLSSYRRDYRPDYRSYYPARRYYGYADPFPRHHHRHTHWNRYDRWAHRGYSRGYHRDYDRGYTRGYERRYYD